MRGNPSLGRRAFIERAGFALAAVASSSLVLPEASQAMPASAKAALATLMAGNARFVADKAECPPLTARRLELADTQSPFAIIVSCSDSRVPVDTVFDQIPGNIFGVREAGNVLGDFGIGSVEYSVAVLKSSLILVLGHTDCGAVKSAIKHVKDGTGYPGQIQTIVNAIVPAVKQTKGVHGNWTENAIAQNVRDNVAKLASHSTIVADAVKAGSLHIAGGIYHLASGKVTLL
ncbi:MAG: carbonic anhydrase [Vulcanimicrobiaceae bacterium]